jgi:CheY-like chemotaxis protein
MARILVIDDVEAIRQAMAIVLENEGHEVVQAGDGLEGIRRLRDGAVDLLITDVLMPGADGIEVIKSVRQHAPQLKVIAMSGGGNQLPAGFSLKTAQAFGAKAVLYKPFENAELVEMVRSVLAEPR